ncbi:hypothetical protein [Promineifilum sp.]|uniref:hypothetical protein n=1 Tax=Promineifilum sp. TaxID=2664178 RepID=UPI0035B397A9
MLDWLYTLLLVALAGLVGGLLTASFLPRGARWSFALVFVALTLAIVATGWLALLLAEFGWFGRWALLVALASSATGLLIWQRRDRAAKGQEAIVSAVGERLVAWEWLMLALWLAAALWLFFQPHEYIYGGADAGVYVSLGAEIAHHGGFRVVDKTLAALDPALQAAVLRPLPNTPGAASYLFPGFYVTDAAAGRLTPQFYPFHPVLQAVAYDAAGGGAAGVRAELLLTGLWMLLGTLAVYLTARDAGGPVVGALALAALSLTALQIWFGRYPTSEALTQFLIWAGVWSAGRWLGERRPAGLWAFTAGCALGAVFLVRIDTLVLLPVFALLLVWRWARGWRQADNWFAAPFALLIFHSLLHGHFLSAPYFYETVGYGLSLVLRAWPLVLVAAAGGAFFLWQLPRRAGRLRAAARFTRPALGTLVILLLAYALYGWFLRPALATTTLRPDVFSAGEIPVTNHENWPRLGWYLTPLGIWLGVLGGALLLWRADRRVGLLLALGWLFAVVYLWNVSANPHHVYVMRRYVPAVVPFFAVGAAYLLGHRGFSRAAWNGPGLLTRLPYPLIPVLVGLVAVAWLAGVGWAARGFVSQVDHAGLLAQVDELAGELPPGAVLLFNDPSPVGQGDIWGTPLRFIYGFDVFSLRQPPERVTVPLAETIETWQNRGWSIVWVGATDWLDSQGYGYQTEEVTLSSRRLEGSYDHKPREVVIESATLILNFLESE